MDSSHIRVFVSSTFSDLIEERDHLARRTFPSLQKRGADLGIMFSAIDLRWGITNEQVAEGSVLPICLDAIDRCRPFFIGIIGDRYGWVPEMRRSAAQPVPGWLNEHADRSITEMEMLYGVLSRPFNEVEAFFYAREPSTPPVNEVDRLQGLRQRIEDAGYSIRPFRSAAELGYLVEEDLGGVLDLAQMWSDSEQVERHNDLFRAVALDGYMPRPAVEGSLASMAGEKCVVILTGAPGSGKTALACTWLDASTDRNALRLFYSCSATQTAGDWRQLCRHIGSRLAAAFGASFDGSGDDEELRRKFHQVIQSVSALRPVRLVLDGVEGLAEEGGARDLAFLPNGIPDDFSLLITTSMDGPAIGQGRRRGWSEFVVPPLGSDERAAMLSRLLQAKEKSLSNQQLTRVSCASAATTPLFLTTLVHELNVTAAHDELDSLLDRYLSCADTAQLMDQVLTRLEQDHKDPADFTRRLLTFVWAAPEGLTDSELGAVLGGGTGSLPTVRIARFLVECGDLLETRGDTVTFANSEFRRAVQMRYLPSWEDQRHVRLALWEALRRGASASTTARMAMSQSVLLLEAHDWQRLNLMLTDIDTLEAIMTWDTDAPVRLWSRLRAAGWDPAKEYQPVISDHSIPGERLESVGVLLDELGEFASARAAYQRVADHFDNDGDLYHLAWCLFAVAETYRSAKDAAGTRTSLAELKGLLPRVDDLETVVTGLILFSHGHADLEEWDEAMKWARTAVDVATFNEDSVSLSVSLVAEAEILTFMGEGDLALSKVDAAVEAAHASGDELTLHCAFKAKGLITLESGDFEESVRAMREAERFANASVVADWEKALAALVGQGAAHLDEGNDAAALQCLADAEHLCRTHGNGPYIGWSLQSQALVESLGLPRRIELLTEAVTLLPDGEWQGAQALLGFLYAEQASLLSDTDPVTSRELLKRASNLFMEVNRLDAAAHTLGELASTWDVESPNTALQIYRRAEALLRGEGRRPRDRNSLAWCLLREAGVLRRIGDRHAFLAALSESERLFRQDKDSEGLARVTEIRRETPQSSPPGWYKDPWGLAELRYWDGQLWTGYVHSAK